MRLAEPSPRPHRLLTLAALLGLAGCFSLAEHPAPPLPPVGEPDAYGTRRLHHEVLAAGGSSLGVGAFAIRAWDEWTALKQHLRVDWDHEPDLDRSTVIFVAVPVPTSGYRLRVDSVYVEGGLLSKRSTHTELVGGEIVVAYTVEEPGEECFVFWPGRTLSQTVVVGVTIDQEVLFAERYETYSCEAGR